MEWLLSGVVDNDLTVPKTIEEDFCYYLVKQGFKRFPMKVISWSIRRLGGREKRRLVKDVLNKEILYIIIPGGN